MCSLFAIVFLIIYGFESFMGTTTSAFIVAVNLVSWAKGTILSHNDQILLSIGLSSLCVQGTSVTAVFSFFFCTQLFVGFHLQVFVFFFMFSNSSYFWLSTFLLVYYTMKVMNTQQPFFLWVKTKIIKNIFWLLLNCFVSSFGFGLTTAYNVSTTVLSETAANLTGNYSKPSILFNNGFYMRLFFIILECTCPLAVTSFLVIQLLKGIWSHAQNMKKSMAGSGVATLNAHRSATNTLTSLLILCVSFHLMMSVVILGILPYYSIGFLICMTLISILTSAQAVTFVLRNPKLKKKALGILQSFRPSTAKSHGQTTGDISYVTSPL
ncbi:taste receptor type 2 member 40-like [Rhineura floridana]|uniref:taste receptor type 2 member 40-like n=1 Tax=Rhineura floridana TaxID=261503 RepID=UPI002AC862F7|nr:taste receptor type 2 member 40-like [Rhineura floridana]